MTMTKEPTLVIEPGPRREIQFRDGVRVLLEIENTVPVRVYVNGSVVVFDSDDPSAFTVRQCSASTQTEFDAVKWPWGARAQPWKELERIVRFLPSADTRGLRGGSLSCMGMIIAVVGQPGAVTFNVLTRWVSNASRERNAALDAAIGLARPTLQGIVEHDTTHALCRPLPVGMFVHSRVELGASGRFHEACPILGGACWTQELVGPLQSDGIWETFVRLGDEALWRELETRYRDAFGLIDALARLRQGEAE